MYPSPVKIFVMKECKFCWKKHFHSIFCFLILLNKTKIYFLKVYPLVIFSVPTIFQWKHSFPSSLPAPCYNHKESVP